MAELATIARPYAEALFKASAGQLDATAGWLDALSAIAAQPTVQEVAANPKVTGQQVYDLIAGLFPQALPSMAQNFLHTVIDNGRLPALPEAAAQFRQLKNQSTGVADAVIQSAYAISPTELQDISAVLERRFGRKLTTHVDIDASLIGGVRVVVGDEVLDTSVKARLEQMKASLTA